VRYGKTVIKTALNAHKNAEGIEQVKAKVIQLFKTNTSGPNRTKPQTVNF
jgi:hypothetical protein